jgi:hypothetical protein
MPSDVDDERVLLQESIERDSADLREAVDELTVAVKRDLEVGNWISANPVPWLAGSLLLGMWLGWDRS